MPAMQKPQSRNERRVLRNSGPTFTTHPRPFSNVLDFPSMIHTSITRQLPLFALIVAVLSTYACSSTPPDTRAADQAAITAADTKWASAAGRDDLDATLAFYSDDASLFPPNAPIAQDKQSIHNVWATLLAPNSALSWKTTKVDVAKSGDLGYAYGTYVTQVKNPTGPPAIDTGKFVEIWRKQADNTWKCVVDIFNSDQPAATAPAPAPKKSAAKPHHAAKKRRHHS